MSIKRTGSKKQSSPELKNQVAPRGGALLAILLAVSVMSFTAGCIGNLSGQTPASKEQLSLRFAPTSLDFGNVPTGKKISEAATVTNTGASSTTITQIVSSSNQFAISGMTFPLTLGPGQTSKFVVWFNGSAPGKTAGTLSFQSQGASTSAEIPVSANAATPLPQLVISPANVDAGSATVGSKTTSTITLSNTGSADLTVSVITVAGAPFNVTGIATPKVISAGQSTTMGVTFAPTAAGMDSGSISILSNDPASPATIGLSGVGTSAPVGHLTLNPSTLTFGNVLVGSSSVLAATVTNSGQGAVHISQVFASGTGYSESGLATPATLAPGQSAQVQVTFAPTATGTGGGTVGITSDAPGTAPGLAMSGTGVQPGISVSPASISFGSLVDGQSKAQPVTITNTGTANLTITQVGPTGAGVSVNGITMPLTIAAGQSTSFNVLYAPQSAGNTNGSVSVASNAPNSPASVAISGTGIAATSTISVNPNVLSFGNVNTGSSANQTITVTNTGNSSTTISQVGVSGQSLSASGLSTPLTLTPGQGASLNVKFSPTSMTSVNGLVSIVSDQGTTTVAVTGTGAQATLAVSQSTVTFSNVVTGSTNSQSIQISNTGNASLTITQANITASGFSASGLSLPATLAAGQSGTVNVQFLPQTAGTVAGSLSLVSNAANSPATIALSGSSVASTQTLSVSASSLNFGSVNDGSSLSKTVTLTNTGNADVSISQITVGGTGFVLSGAGTGITLSPGQSTSFNVQFSPTTAGAVTGSASITSNASGSPAAVGLTGTGVAQVVQHSVQLSWTGSTSTVAGYNVYRTTTSGTGYVRVNSSLVGPDDFSDGAVQSGTTYYYVTTAVDASGDESGYSNEAPAIIP
jgi:hypothetical protein